MEHSPWAFEYNRQTEDLPSPPTALGGAAFNPNYLKARSR